MAGNRPKNITFRVQAAVFRQTYPSGRLRRPRFSLFGRRDLYVKRGIGGGD